MTRSAAAHGPAEEVVLVGHGTARTIVAADLEGTLADLDRWHRLGLPDVWSHDPPLG